MKILELINGSMRIEELNALLFIGIALFGGTIGGRLFQKIRIPQVVGYILIGLALGESGMGFLSSVTLDRFQAINYFALGLISFSLGGELKFATLKKNGRQFTYILFLEALGAFFLVSLAVFWPLRILFSDSVALAVSLLLGSIAAATAAAGTTDVLSEYRARGIVTSTLLGIIALDDILALFLFTILAGVAAPLLGFGGENLLASMMFPLYETFGAVALGLLSGFALIWLLKKYTEEEKIFVFAMGAILLVLGASIFLDVDMLMTAMIMGAVLVNKAPRKSKIVFNLIERFSTPIYVLFFVFVGASLKFASLSPLILLMIGIFILARFTGKTLGVRLGGRLSGAPNKLRKYLPYCLLSQSGVAVGLAIVAAQRFPGAVGETILIMVTTSTFILQLLGPTLIKYAVDKADEAGKNISEEVLKEQLKLAELLSPEDAFVRDATPISEVIHRFAETSFSELCVLDKNDRLIGVISFDNLKTVLVSSELNHFLLAVDIMSPLPVLASPELSLREAEKRMRKTGVEYIAAVDGEGRFRGIAEQRGIDGFARKRYLAMQET
ncbi:cation:proton antiporter [Marispirochaeta aestuarii]|uniref:cation:proton antiporter domain-containing protein n=1 Tax=Marispirochaeta aestuarii TaxID=1963862 RepID=UPI0029C670DD|nr:cation:proton antiporter [Marispirochaeta aestuarii]